MKKLLIVFVLLLVLGGGGGAAAWWYYFRAPDAPEDAGPSMAQLSQLELDTIPITVVRNGKPTYQFFFRIVLTDDTNQKTKV